MMKQILIAAWCSILVAQLVRAQPEADAKGHQRARKVTGTDNNGM
jgi:hypothetical protein